MLWPPPALSVIVFGGVVLAVIVAVTAYRQRPDSMATPVTVVMIAAAAWALPAGIGFAAVDLQTAIRAEQARYLGTVLTPIAYYVLAMRYAGFTGWIRRWVLGTIAVIPTITLALAMTNQYHAYLWQDAELVRVIGGTTLVTEPGVWFPVHVAWAYGLILVSLGVLTREFMRVDPHNRRQAGALLLGALIPLLTNVAHQAQVTGTAADFTPVALAVSGAIFAVALFRFDLIELGPIARNRVIEEIPDGVIVIDGSGRIREFNEVAGRMIDGIARGRAETEVIPAEFAETGGEFPVQVDGETRRYRCDRRPFHDNRGRVFGELLYLRDVSAIARREQRISVLNRVLRHNIRNELTIQLGHLELLRDEPADPEHHLNTVENSIRRVQGFADQARLVDRTLREPASVQAVSIDPVIDEAIASVGIDHPDAHVERSAEADFIVETIDRELLGWVVAELIENAIVHGGEDEGTVTVDVSSDGDDVTIAVLDDGPGIPEDEMVAIHSTVETALDHGSGIGLWLARWTAQRSDGDLHFDERDGRNAVCLSLPSHQ